MKTPGSGRKKGTPNKRTLQLQEKLTKWGCDPFKVLADTANGDLPCNVCRGKRKTKFQAGNGAEPGERTCQSCWGSGKEQVSPKERLSAAAELAQYLEPKRKAIEHSLEAQSAEALVAILQARRDRIAKGEEPNGQ